MTVFSDNCNQTLSSVTSGNLAIPTTPVGYHGPQTCTWSISVTTGYTIAVMIAAVDVRIVHRKKSFFKHNYGLQIEDQSACANNYLGFHDGVSATSSLFGNGGSALCGSTPPDHFMSTTNEMFVVFRTDGTLSRPSLTLAFERGSNRVDCINFRNNVK